jgi:Fe-S cluster assembly scaffold protein SufB
VFLALGLVAIVGAVLFQHFHLAHAAGMLLASGVGSILFGVNSVAYETPVTGATAPTATQDRTHQSLSAVVTGDGAATTFTITHNWGLSAAELTASWPFVEYEYLLAAGYTAAALISSKTANAVAFTCTAFTGAGLRVRLMRPWTPLR